MLHDVEAVVLVGGKGTRLRPLTLSAPKPMLPTAGVPFLAHLLSRIRESGVRRVVLGTSYLAETFSDHFGDGSALGLEIEYVVENEPLGTGGGIRNVFKHLSADDVLVFNGDVLAGTDLTAVVDTHRRTKADATLHLVRVQDPRAFGCVPTDDDGRVRPSSRRPTNPPTDQINAGCYVFRREVIESIPAGRPVSVERETFPGCWRRVRGCPGTSTSPTGCDMGTPADFVRGSADLVRGVAPSAALPGPTGESLVLEGARSTRRRAWPVARRSAGTRPSARAPGSTGSMLFDGAVVGDGARSCTRWSGRGARVDESALVSDTVIGDGPSSARGCELRHGMRVWPDVVLPPHGIRFSADV